MGRIKWLFSFCRIGSTLQTYSSKDFDRRPRPVTTPASLLPNNTCHRCLFAWGAWSITALCLLFPLWKTDYTVITATVIHLWLEEKPSEAQELMLASQLLLYGWIFSRTEAFVTTRRVITSSKAGHAELIWIEFEKATKKDKRNNDLHLQKTC